MSPPKMNTPGNWGFEALTPINRGSNYLRKFGIIREHPSLISWL